MNEKASVMEKYDVTKQEKRTLENSLTELCHRLKTISQQNLATTITTPPPVTASVSQPVTDDPVSNTVGGSNPQIYMNMLNKEYAEYE